MDEEIEKLIINEIAIIIANIISSALKKFLRFILPPLLKAHTNISIILTQGINISSKHFNQSVTCITDVSSPEGPCGCSYAQSFAPVTGGMFALAGIRGSGGACHGLGCW